MCVYMIDTCVWSIYIYIYIFHIYFICVWSIYIYIYIFYIYFIRIYRWQTLVRVYTYTGGCGGKEGRGGDSNWEIQQKHTHGHTYTHKPTRAHLFPNQKKKRILLHFTHRGKENGNGLCIFFYLISPSYMLEDLNIRCGGTLKYIKSVSRYMCAVHTNMFMYVYSNLHIYMYICRRIGVYLCVYIYVYVCVYVRTCKVVYIEACVYVYIYIHTYFVWNLHYHVLRVCIYVYTRQHVCTCMHTYFVRKSQCSITCVCAYMYIEGCMLYVYTLYIQKYEYIFIFFMEIALSRFAMNICIYIPWIYVYTYNIHVNIYSYFWIYSVYTYNIHHIFIFFMENRAFTFCVCAYLHRGVYVCIYTRKRVCTYMYTFFVWKSQYHFLCVRICT